MVKKAKFGEGTGKALDFTAIDHDDDSKGVTSERRNGIIKYVFEGQTGRNIVSHKEKERVLARIREAEHGVFRSSHNKEDYKRFIKQWIEGLESN